MKINSFNIDTSDMSTGRVVKPFTITGDKGAEFEIIALQNPSSSSNHTLYYDWKSKSFEAGHNDSHNNLRVKLSGRDYTNNIIFPSGGGDYVIKLITINGTETSSSNSKVITKNISKAAANTTITFKPGSADTTYYQTLPTSTSVGAVTDTGVVNFSWSVLNSTTDAKSFGFRLTNPTDIKYNYWYFTTTENVVTNPQGDTEDTKYVVVADTTYLCVGMELTYYKATTAPENKAGSAVGLTTIVSIVGNEIWFSQAVGFDEGQTMTFRAYGKYIKDAIGLDLNFSTTTASAVSLQKTVEARGGVTETTDGSSTSIALPNTLGVGVGTRYLGFGVDNSSTNLVTAVTPDADGTGNDGIITVGLAQTLEAGTALTFPDTHSQIDFNGIITVNSYSSTTPHTIYLDLDKILTVGAGS
tara:strand:+ start:182 stop:1423 length:1242 start_codon:yes stop_codon:yes gene_type:complete